MPDFTDEQIREACENPKVGDVWEEGTARYGFQCAIGNKVLLFTEERDGERGWWFPLRCEFSEFTRNATLIRRGA